MRKTGMIALAALLVGTSALAQAPEVGLPPVSLTEPTYVFDTGEQHKLKVSVLVKSLPRPFAIDLLPNGDLLVMERGGDLRVLRGATGPSPVFDSTPIPGMPHAAEKVFSYGAQDITLDPDFARTGLLYFTWNDPAPLPEGANPLQRQGTFKLMRGKLADGKLSNVETLFTADKPGYAGGSRVAIGKDGKIFVTTGAPFGEAAQDLASPYGKVLRFNADGSIPADNPFVGRAGANPAVYTLGHRDQHGLFVNRATGEVFACEHGPNGGDEVNRLAPGANYGWPKFTYGRDYNGAELAELPTGPGMTKPLVVWNPSIGSAGLMIYDGDKFPAWKGNMFVGSSRRGEIPGTGGLERVVLGEGMGDVRRETLLTQLGQRVRDVAQGPDGLIYVLTDGPENTVLRLEPSE